MKPNRFTLRVLGLFAALALVLPFSASAQQAEPQDGIESGNYNIKQSVEFGGRITSIDGNNATYRTFVNLQKGPRLLEQTLEMRSLNHQGWLFDDFFVTSFGYGGDPNAVTRLRAYKNKWYNFGGTFRLDRNQWDYALLANPLNPASSNPFFPITVSPHKLELVRRMSDFNLTLLPQSPLRVRMGYARNINEGPSFSSFHEGTDVLLLQNWKTTLNAYSFGVDFRGLPKTNISYDQFFYYYKGDSTWADTVGTTELGVPRFFAQLSTGAPVDLGIPFNTSASQPCATPISNSTTTPPTANPACNGYLFYNRAGNVRTNYPTEQLSFQTSYFKNLDFSGRLAYSHSDNDVFGYNEGFLGRVTRTNERIFGFSGPVNSKRVSVTADSGITWRPVEKLRLVDAFHFTHFRLPGSFINSECFLYGTRLITNPIQWTGQAAVPANCAGVLATTATSVTSGTPTHTASSSADVISGQLSRFFGQNMKQNTFEVLYDFTRRFSGRIGYRYANRKFTEFEGEGVNSVFFPNNAARGSCALVGGVLPAGCTQNADGSITFVQPFDFESPDKTIINEHSLLLGVSARPVDQVRMSFDSELFWADNVFTRISPRKLYRYKIRTSYKPRDWASFNLAVNLLQWRNPVIEVLHRQYSRAVDLGMALEPSSKWALDFGYDYNEIFSQTNICYVLGFGPLPKGATACPIAGSPAPISGLSRYKNKNHFGYFDAMWKPFKRLTTRLGYSLVSVDGFTTYPGSELADAVRPPAPPFGTLRYNFHRPNAGVDFEIARGFTWRAGWNYYDYNEKAVPDALTSPRDAAGNLIGRDFRSNIVTLSVRYAF